MSHTTLRADAIAEFHDNLGLPCAAKADLCWVCEQIEAFELPTRALSVPQLNALNTRIRQFVTGRQRHLKAALDQTLHYLKERCEWELPAVQTPVFKDTQQQWLLSILKQSAAASSLLHAYHAQRASFVRERWEEMGWLLLVLNIEVAPLPLRYWQRTLTSPESIEWFEGRMTLTVEHTQALANFTSKEQPSFTRYPLSLFAYKVLQSFYLHPPCKHLTTTRLTRALNAWCEGVPYCMPPRSDQDWHKLFQAIWYHHHALPVPLLRDFSDPERHVATLECAHQRQARASTKSSTLSPSARVPLLSTPSEGKASSPASASRSWPHKTLIRSLKPQSKKNRLPPTLGSDNVLPWFFYHFADSLHREGGVIKKTLGADTIDRYTNFYSQLSPLSLKNACDPEALPRWARDQFERITDKTTPWHLFNFLRFMTHIELTDHLDLSQFERPTLPSQVDPFRLSAQEVHDVAMALLRDDQSGALDGLFSATAVLLGYYAMLRRGEMLRLRLGDISYHEHDKQRFELIITRTKEGAPKGNKTRITHAYLPEVCAKLIRAVIKLKAQCPPDTPLLGYAGESFAQRDHYYLYPVSQRLKAHFGPQIRFHHLRHSGAELLYLQGLHLAYQRSGEHLQGILEPTTLSLLTPQACQARFDFWLEGRAFDDVNDGILLDVIGDEIGHSYYSTTRKHYLHDMVKVGLLISPHRRVYHRDELRYLLGMSPGSNDISRVLNALEPNYALMTNEQKKRCSLSLCDAQLITLVCDSTTRQAKALSQDISTYRSAALPKPPRWDENTLIKAWLSTLDAQSHALAPFSPFTKRSLSLRPGQPVAFLTLSEQWLAMARGDVFRFDRKARTQLRALGRATVGATKAQDGQAYLTLSFDCRCNDKTRKAYLALFHHGPLQRCNAELTLYQNRKQKARSPKLDKLNAEFARPHDRVKRLIVPAGDTRLVITVHTRVPAQDLQDSLQTYFDHLTHNKQKDAVYA
ncbi:site-specific integrase [Vibrio alginolyticus]|uniref:site-specific integrase n=1 Tax=Vibrio alginolyticus TaxID=663 RepID=UPI001BD5AC48|nr:site-specific integrase [Vibrio alginolyticus]MBS9811369.1 site-specific integrase [Vibrio alginolyticus]